MQDNAFDLDHSQPHLLTERRQLLGINFHNGILYVLRNVKRHRHLSIKLEVRSISGETDEISPKGCEKFPIAHLGDAVLLHKCIG